MNNCLERLAVSLLVSIGVFQTPTSLIVLTELCVLDGGNEEIVQQTAPSLVAFTCLFIAFSRGGDGLCVFFAKNL